MTLHEVIGQKEVALLLAEANYTAALQCLADVISGRLEPSRVIVNLTERSFFWVAPGERPVLPATVNGLPVCVVAPDPSPQEPAS